MKYQTVIDDFNYFAEIYSDIGKIPNFAFMKCNYPNAIKQLIQEDYRYVKEIIDIYISDTMRKLSTNSISSLHEIVKLGLGGNKFNDLIFDFLNSDESDFFADIFDNFSMATTIVNIDEIKACKEEKQEKQELIFEPRINQKEAFDRLEKYGLETGIHCQATGCGKTFIILKSIECARLKNKVNKIILFTERVNILADLFQFSKDKNILEKDIKNVAMWKEMGICDLTDFTIINRVTTKKDDWMNLLTNSKENTLLVINRAYLTLKKNYLKLDDKLTLILHDECHNTSSVQCHAFLKHCKSLDIPIVGFSATPLRTGKNDAPKLLEIYGKNDKLNLLTDYNMMYAISNNLILPPEFYWYKIDHYNQRKDENKVELVSQEELGSVLELLNYIVPKMPNKKIVAWCGTIKLANKWKQLFESNYKQRKNLVDMTFGIDTSQNSSDYDRFKNSKGNMILFCACKHREGSDIKFLDACIFLDKVKDRSSIPFIQAIGRVLRICYLTPNKKSGIIIDGFVKDNANYEKEFVHKIIGYYLALQNISNWTAEAPEQNQYEVYIKLLDIVKFDKENNVIDLQIGNNNIKINCSKLQWEDITKEFAAVLNGKIKLSEDEKIIHEYKILKDMMVDKNLQTIDDYKKYAADNGLELEPENKYKKHGWTNYYDFLNIDIGKYDFFDDGYMNNFCKKYKILDEDMYFKIAYKKGLPLMPRELLKQPMDQFFYKQLIVKDYTV